VDSGGDRNAEESRRLGLVREPRPRGDSGPRTVLAVGSGTDPLSEWQEKGYTVVRLDIDPGMRPDIVASMTDLGPIGPFDVVYCSHALEHIYPHEVPLALAEFRRVLKVRGKVVILVPDLEDVRPTTDRLVGDLCGLHLFYGDSRCIPTQPYMAHHCGFVAETLYDAMTAAGFDSHTKRSSGYQLVGIGVKTE
jgi:SAM-dependent methyltransferase